MINEILIPLAVELRKDPYIGKIRERAAFNAGQMVNIQNRLDSGVIIRFGEEVSLTDSQVQRRKDLLPHLEASLLYDLETLKGIAVRERRYGNENTPVNVQIPDSFQVSDQSTRRFNHLRSNS